MVNTTKEDAPETFSVVSTDGKRTYFEGTEDDAHAYVLANFPRIHIEPGTNYGADGPEPDAYVMKPDGSYAWYDGADWYEDSASPAASK